MKIEFVGQSARDSSNQTASTGRLVNLFREPSMDGGYALRAVLGMALVADMSRAAPRAMLTNGDYVLIALGGGLFWAGPNSAGFIINMPNSAETSMARYGSKAAIVAGGQYHVWDGTALAAIAVGSNNTVGSVAQLSGYMVVSELNGRRIWWSALADPNSMPALNFASAEITDEPIVRLLSVGDTLLVFKANGFEMWGITGQAGASAFARVNGLMVETGLAGYGLACLIQNGAAFVGSDGRAYLWNGSSVQPISTPPVEVAIAGGTAKSVLFYILRGHGFICLMFSDRPAWCFDVATGEWHERAENDSAWTARLSARLGNDWLVVSETGRIAKLTAECSDFGQPMTRTAVSRTLRQGGPVSISKITAFPRTAVDLQAAGQLPDSGPASVSLATSRDGVTFGPPKARSVGDAGRFGQCVTWRALGQFRNSATIALSMSSLSELPLSATIELELSQ